MGEILVVVEGAVATDRDDTDLSSPRDVSGLALDQRCSGRARLPRRAPVDRLCCDDRLFRSTRMAFDPESTWWDLDG